MTDPFQGIDTTRPYHRPNSRGQTVKIQGRIPQDQHRALQIIKESGVYGHETLTDAMVHCLHIGTTIALEAVHSPQASQLSAMLAVMAESDANKFHAQMTVKVMDQLAKDWFSATTEASKEEVKQQAIKLAPWLDKKDRDYLSQCLGVELPALRAVNETK